MSSRIVTCIGASKVPGFLTWPLRQYSFGPPFFSRLERAFVLTREDAPEAAAARADVLQVDSFAPAERFGLEQVPLLRSRP